MPYCPAGPTTRSAEFARSHGLPLVSVIPCDSMTMTGYWRPVTVPIATSFGGAVSATLSALLSRLKRQFAFTVQVTSPTVCDIPDPHVAGGPACDAGAPQSASANLITPALSLTGSVNVTVKVSPLKRRPGALGFGGVSTAFVDVNPPPMVELVTQAVT